ncbi:hypothetical protein N7445_006302 [Penicillium cf. griseofulvum]|nr:hypothetical protein N7445_006302 [Penicillium cf. griseofulvum]
MTKLLIAHGAHVNATAIFSAIELHETVILETLLSHGSDSSTKRGAMRPTFLILRSHLFSLPVPLHCDSLSLTLESHPRSNNLDKDALDARIMTILLNHGADPFTTYVGELSPGYSIEESDSDLDDPELHRRTVIHEILKSGHVFNPFFQLPSVQLELRDSSGCKLLLAASQSEMMLRGRSSITNPTFRELIDRGADVMAQYNDGNTILHHIRPPRVPFGFIVPLTVDSELLKTLKEVIIRNPGLLHQRDRKGETFFHRILLLGDFNIIDDLLEMRADPLQPDSNGDTALHHLAKHLRENQLQAHFKRFLEADVDINSRNCQGDTPLFKYIENGVPEHFEKEDDLTETIFGMFEEARVDFFAPNNAGSSLLHLLASKRKVAGMILMSRGLDPMLEDARQRTSLDVAAVCGSEHIIKLFA